MKSPDQKQSDYLRHSCAHLLAAAVMELWPVTKLTIGPAIENGFYYDFDFSKPPSEEDLPKIEETMQQILPTWTHFERQEITPQEAKVTFKGNPYKLEIIGDLEKNKETITIYKSGDFADLCRGGHCQNPSKDIGAFKLLSIAGAYWRGSEKNPMLTRIYGTCFPTKRELDKHLTSLEEAKKRDHKKLGPKLELFFFHETAPGMPYWLPKGVVIYNELLAFWRQEHQKRDYQETVSPILNKKELYVTSGHFKHFWQDMFVADMGKNEVYGIKAMNCPNAMTIYAFKPRSYRDLPIRLSDTDPLHRYELSGVLNGLLRVREFRQDDAHIFASEDQIESEFKNLFEIVEKFYSVFNLEYSYRLGTRPEKFMGDIKTWDHAQKVLENILKASRKPFTIENGEGAFYGPKIDIIMKDSLGRKWQMGTLQLDFQQPKNFKLKYIDQNGKEKTPIAIHRVIYGSLERFIAILIEHYAGALPIWLSPIQTIVLPLSDKFTKYAQNIYDNLKETNIRVEIDNKNETLQLKIRNATLQKIPYLLIVGAKEESSKTVAIRTREGKDLGTISINDFTAKITEEIEAKSYQINSD